MLFPVAFLATLAVLVAGCWVVFLTGDDELPKLKHFNFGPAAATTCTLFGMDSAFGFPQISMAAYLMSIIGVFALVLTIALSRIHHVYATQVAKVHLEPALMNAKNLRTATQLSQAYWWASNVVGVICVLLIATYKY
ncbi:hypothetical protein H6G33_38140 [Calothrix sp. FACHB-1219]|uniref:hypothetical protein n=1 Tax=Calothrix sp. FACHB-1219 TaxID=2692778 RepID=UPI0016835680|nr:hypothetical protein [Calothrix sp. FACHB-1219]